jgi:hypothetical protein
VNPYFAGVTFSREAHLILCARSGPAPRVSLNLRQNSRVMTILQLPDSGSGNRWFESTLPS